MHSHVLILPEEEKTALMERVLAYLPETPETPETAETADGAFDHPWSP